MEFIKPLQCKVIIHKYIDFQERTLKNKNIKVIELIRQYDFSMFGVVCKLCCNVLPIYEFNITRTFISLRCKNCILSSQCPFSKMLNNMKTRSKKRGHSPPEFTVEDLKALFEKQNGKCSISGMQLCKECNTGNVYNMSPERLDNDIHYTKENVVLICQWLQIGGRNNFLPDEIRSWFNYDKDNDGFSFDASIFSTTKQIKDGRKKRNWNDPVRQCLYCKQSLSVDSFYSFPCSVCKSCERERVKNYSYTPRGCISRIARNCKSHANVRGKNKRRRDDSGVVDSDMKKLLVDLISKQEGRCAITGIPFVYDDPNSPFRPSPDRIDNSVGYVDGNIVMIIYPLNTAKKPTLDELLQIKNNNLFF